MLFADPVLHLIPDLDLALIFVGPCERKEPPRAIRFVLPPDQLLENLFDVLSLSIREMTSISLKSQVLYQHPSPVTSVTIDEELNTTRESYEYLEHGDVYQP